VDSPARKIIVFVKQLFYPAQKEGARGEQAGQIEQDRSDCCK